MIKKLTSSLSFRLLFLMIIVALFIMVILYVFSEWVEKQADESYHFEATVVQYLLYINKDIGYPPDFEKAEKIKSMIGVQIIITSETFGHWPDDQSIAEMNQLSFEERELDLLPQDYRLATHRSDDEYDDFGLFRLTTPNQIVYLSWDYSFSSLPGFNRALLTVIGLLLFTLLCCYLVIRYQISPVNQISKNVQRFAMGALQQRIKTNRKDELGELAGHINNMEDQITSMLDAKRQLLLGISHELRTPLTRAKLSLAMLPDDQTSQDLERDLNEMEAQINDLLESERLNSKHQALNLAPVSINQLVEEVIKTYFDNKSFELNLPDGDPYVLVDAPRIRLLIKNLLTNAVKYGDEKPIELSVGLTDSKLCVKVIDQGPGISEEHLKRLTEPFYRPDTARTRTSGGAGLGLYLCRLIVEAHAGELQIHSTLGAGSEFTALIPLKTQH